MSALPDPKSLALAREEAVPVTVLTGFLGSGKTTLIRRLLALPEAADTAVIVNEFGEVGLDHALVEKLDGSVVLLPGGCLCCLAQGDMARALRSLQHGVAAGRLPSFRRVVVETSGLADPAPLLQAFLSDPLRLSRYRLAALVAAADCVLAADHLARHREAAAQLALADKVLLTKLDIAGDAAGERLRQQLAAAGIRRIERVASGDGLLDQLFEAALPFRFRAAMPGPGQGHSRAFASIAAKVPDRLDLAALQAGLEAMAARHGARLLRLKGIVDTAGDPRPVSVHAVQHMVALPRFLDAVPAGSPRAVVAVCPAEAADMIRGDLKHLVGRAAAAARQAAEARGLQ
jgi:G3E family GTPase